MKKNIQEYFNYLEDFLADLESIAFSDLVKEPDRACVIVVDMTNAFCCEGPLASERVAAIIDPVTALLRGAWDHGIPNIILLNDNHSPDAKEFDAFGQHALQGSSASESVDAIKALPFYDSMLQMEKNSVDPSHGTELPAWLARHPQVDTFIVVGDCTDICVYLTCMYLKTSANAADQARRVVVPVNCVDTYDLTVEAAQSSGLEPHPAEILHPLFLHHLKLHAMELYSGIQ